MKKLRKLFFAYDLVKNGNPTRIQKSPQYIV